MSIYNATIPLSGFNAASTRLAVSADNVARVNAVDGAAKNRVNQASNEHGGVSVTIQQIPVPEGTPSEPDMGFTATNINIAEESIQQDIGLVSGKVSLISFDVQDENMQALLDIKI